MHFEQCTPLSPSIIYCCFLFTESKWVSHVIVCRGTVYIFALSKHTGIHYMYIVHCTVAFMAENCNYAFIAVQLICPFFYLEYPDSKTSVNSNSKIHLWTDFFFGILTFCGGRLTLEFVGGAKTIWSSKTMKLLLISKPLENVAKICFLQKFLWSKLLHTLIQFLETFWFMDVTFRYPECSYPGSEVENRTRYLPPLGRQKCCDNLTALHPKDSYATPYFLHF